MHYKAAEGHLLCDDLGRSQALRWQQRKQLIIMTIEADGLF